MSIELENVANKEYSKVSTGLKYKLYDITSSAQLLFGLVHEIIFSSSIQSPLKESSGGHGGVKSVGVAQII